MGGEIEERGGGAFRVSFHQPKTKETTAEIAQSPCLLVQSPLPARPNLIHVRPTLFLARLALGRPLLPPPAASGLLVIFPHVSSSHGRYQQLACVALLASVRATCQSREPLHAPCAAAPCRTILFASLPVADCPSGTPRAVIALLASASSLRPVPCRTSSHLNTRMCTAHRLQKQPEHRGPDSRFTPWSR